MKLVSITLNDVRRFTTPVRISGIGSGLNVLSAPNENGKSTLFDALQAVFFTPHRSNTKDIKALKPHAGGAPEVTVEVDVPEGRFRICKRWSSRAMAEVWQGDRLVAKADEAEAWISRLTTSGGDGGPAGLLWVRQGMTHLDHDTAKENQGTLTTRRDLMSSVTGEVEALTGGRRMDLALNRARADLAPLLTANGRVKADGPLAKADQDVASLTARQTELQTIAHQLSSALERRAQIRRTLAELQDPIALADRKHRLAEANLAYNVAHRHAEVLGRAEVDVKMARLQVAEASSRLGSLAQARDAAARARTAKDAAQSHAFAAQANLAQADSQAQVGLVALNQARDGRNCAEQVLRSCLRADAGRGSEARRQDLVARLATLSTLSTELAVERLAAAQGPDAKTLATLEAQAQEVAVLRAVQTRSATRITMAYSGDQRVRLNGVEVMEGHATSVLSETTMELPGLGQLTIHPAENPVDLVRLQKGEADLTNLLARMGCATPDDARLQARLRAEAAVRVKEIENRIITLAPKGISALEVELSQLPEPLAEDADLPPAAAAQAAVDAAALVLVAAEVAHDAARSGADLERLTEARATVSAQTAGTALSVAEAVVAAFGDPLLAEAEFMSGLSTAETAMTSALDRHKQLAAQAPNLAQAEAALTRASSVAKGVDADIATLSEERAGLDREIDLRSGEGVGEDLADVTARLAAAHVHRDRYLFEVAVLKDLITALEAARDTARERYFEPVMAELKPLLRLLWPDAELKFDGESLLPTTLIRGGVQEDIGILSGGTQEQIALFVRLAFARLLAKTGRHAPVILDDALVFTDDDRIERIFDALHGQAHDLQIIVLSCRQRAFRDLGGQKLMLSQA